LLLTDQNVCGPSTNCSSTGSVTVTIQGG
jgi:hypothetical protein